MSGFKTKQELAVEYFPHNTAESARKGFVRFINKTPGLLKKLQAVG